MEFRKMRLVRDSTESWMTAEAGEPLSLDEWEQVIQIDGLVGWRIDDFYVLCQQVLEDERWNW